MLVLRYGERKGISDHRTSGKWKKGILRGPESLPGRRSPASWRQARSLWYCGVDGEGDAFRLGAEFIHSLPGARMAMRVGDLRDYRPNGGRYKNYVRAEFAL